MARETKKLTTFRLKESTKKELRECALFFNRSDAEIIEFQIHILYKNCVKGKEHIAKEREEVEVKTAKQVSAQTIIETNNIKEEDGEPTWEQLLRDLGSY